ncbi:MAG: tRNA(Ile)-lysidine synthase [Verrucomicrobiota bacterium]|jgi:tRNA(Ile)-lysidine synthase
MSKLVQHIEAAILKRRLFADGDRLVIAVSGGLDSMVLLDVIRQLAKTHRWRICVAHFNHRLRGRASDADEKLVKRSARAFRLAFVRGAWRKADQERTQSHGLEMAARLARHQFLAAAARRWKASTIVLAHHGDDQAELFFLRLLRGAGGGGLAGMKWRDPSPATPQLALVRPLLDLSKKDLAVYARAEGIVFREDVSNQNTAQDRNWIRKRLLPSLVRRFGASAIQTIQRTMELTGVEADFARHSAEAWLWASRDVHFNGLHPAVQRHVVRLQLSRLALPAGFELVEYLRGPANRPIAVAPGELILRNDEGILSRCAAPSAAFGDEVLDVTLSDEGRCVFDGTEFHWSRQRVKGAFRLPPPRVGQEWFDAEKIGSQIRLRHWKPGDRFQPIGMTAGVKLQDLFTNARIDAARRRKLVVGETGDGRIFWVEGLRMGELFKLSEGTRFRLKWNWQLKRPAPVK